MDTELSLRIALALAIGLVVGVERGWRERDEAPGSRTAGVRTYSLIGLLGGVFGAIAKVTASPVLIGIGFVGFILVFAWFKHVEAKHDDDFSVTGTVAAMLVYGLAAYAVVGDEQLAAAGGIGTAAILASRESLHELVRRVTWIELRSALLLLGMTVIILPLLPDRTLDPLGAFNPRQIWLFTVMVAGLSYAGYIAMRVLGPTMGVLVTGLTGGMVSSTAVTVAFARRSASGEDPNRLAAGAATAGAVSLLRVFVIVSIIQPALTTHIAPIAIAAAAVFLAPAVLSFLRPGKPQSDEGGTTLGNPFELMPVLGFALLLAVISLAAAWVNLRFGAAGLYPLAAISGLVDVDAVSLSTARLAGGQVEIGAATIAIVLALASNAIARAVYAGLLGKRAFAMRLALVTAAAIVVGAVAAIASRLWL